MKVSIAMATYKGAKYLIEQLDSLRLQTYPVDEIVFTDDGSPDETVQMLKDYIAKYGLGEKWRVYENEHNLGYADNFHEALTKCSGDYVFFADQDDIWLPEKVEKMVDIMQKNPQIKTLCCDFEPFSSSDDAPSISADVLKRMNNSGKLEKIEMDRYNIFIRSLGCLMCMSREFINNAEKYWYSGWPHDEYVWKLAECYDGLYVIHSNLIKRRLHSNNVSMRKFHDSKARIKHLEDLLLSHSATLKCAKDAKMPEKKIKLLERNIRSTELRIDLLKNRRLRNSFKLLRYTDCYYSRKSILVEPWMVVKKK